MKNMSESPDKAEENEAEAIDSRTKLRVSIYRKSGGNAQTSVPVTYPNHGNAEINFLEICSCFRHVS